MTTLLIVIFAGFTALIILLVCLLDRRDNLLAKKDWIIEGLKSDLKMSVSTKPTDQPHRRKTDES